VRKRSAVLATATAWARRRKRTHGDLRKEVDVIIVVGAKNSSNSNRLCEIGAKMGVPSHLIADSADLRRE
jgi:4-hydroxy-3-methylbut-2-enyl diphosphate reductase